MHLIWHHIVVEYLIHTLRLQEEQNSTNVLEVSLIINQYYALSRKLRQHHNKSPDD
jgi:hypothetical protein